MPRYFFHIHDDLVSRDEEGMELADSAAAIREARRGARSMAAEQVLRNGGLVLHHFVEIEDWNGDVLARVTFADAIAIVE